MTAVLDDDIAGLPVLDYPPITEDLEDARAQIDEYGLAIVGNALTAEEVAVIDQRLTEQAAGEAALGLGTIMRGDEGFGVKTSKEERTSRLLWNLVNKGECFLPLIDHPKTLPLIQHILGERVILGSIGAHLNGPRNERQPLHQDQWPLIPHRLPFAAWANVMWFITPNSPENGCTRLIPGSHQWPAVSPRLVNSKAGQRLARSLTAPAGTAIVFEGRVWHGNGLNRSGAVRSNISISYAPPWVRPQENHQYSVREEVIGRASERQRAILGFSHFGTLGGHDGSSVSRAAFDRHRESIGILHPAPKVG